MGNSQCYHESTQEDVHLSLENEVGDKQKDDLMLEMSPKQGIKERRQGKKKGKVAKHSKEENDCVKAVQTNH